MTTATPFTPGNEPLRAAIDAGRGLLDTPDLLTSPGVIEPLVGRIREAFGRVRRGVAAGYLDAQMERALLEQRLYQKRAFDGGPRLRASIQAPGDKAGMLVSPAGRGGAAASALPALPGAAHRDGAPHHRPVRDLPVRAGGPGAGAAGRAPPGGGAAPVSLGTGMGGTNVNRTAHGANRSLASGSRSKFPTACARAFGSPLTAPSVRNTGPGGVAVAGTIARCDRGPPWASLIGAPGGPDDLYASGGWDDRSLRPRPPLGEPDRRARGPDDLYASGGWDDRRLRPRSPWSSLVGATLRLVTAQRSAPLWCVKPASKLDPEPCEHPLVLRQPQGWQHAF